MGISSDDEHWMRQALSLAKEAARLGEVPVGAVLVRDGELLGQGFNRVIASNDPSAHAEVVALRDAAARVGNYRLPDSTLYVTLEPCTMCVGAIIHARIARLVFATREPRAGVVCSQAQMLEQSFFNHHLEWDEGILAEESAAMLQAFFRARR